MCLVATHTFPISAFYTWDTPGNQVYLVKVLDLVLALFVIKAHDFENAYEALEKLLHVRNFAVLCHGCVVHRKPGMPIRQATRNFPVVIRFLGFFHMTS